MQRETLIPKTSSSSVFYALASITLAILALIYFDNIIKPLVVAFLVWFVINQLKISINRITVKGRSLPPLASGILAMVVILLVIYLVVELLILNIEGIVTSMPEYLAKFHDSYKELSALVHDPKNAEYLQKWIKGLNLAGMASSAINSLSSLMANFAVVIVYVIFFLMEEGTEKSKIGKLFPDKGKAYERFQNNLMNINKSIRFYIWSMTLISLITAVVSYIVLLIMGVEYAFLWSFLVFILNFVPYIGPLVSSSLPAIFAFITTGDFWQFIYVFAALEIIQVVLGNFVQPKLQGKGTNLSPVVVLVALAFWGMVWGIVGMILAVPIMAVIVIICSQIPESRYLAILLSEKGEIDGPEE